MRLRIPAAIVSRAELPHRSALSRLDSTLVLSHVLAGEERIISCVAPEDILPGDILRRVSSVLFDRHLGQHCLDRLNPRLSKML